MKRADQRGRGLTWRHLLGIAVAMAASQPAFSQDRAVQIRGIGRSSCASWLSTPAKEAEGTVWVLGFWTGANAFSEGSGSVGSTTDAEGILALVKRRCAADPSALLMSAVTQAYIGMQTSNR